MRTQVHTHVRRAENKAHRAAWNHAVAQFRFIPPAILAEPKQPEPELVIDRLPKVIHLEVVGVAPVPCPLVAHHFGCIPVIHRRSRDVEHDSCLGTLAVAIQS